MLLIYMIRKNTLVLMLEITCKEIAKKMYQRQRENVNHSVALP